MRGARIYYPRVPRLMRDDHRRISSRCVRNRNSSCTTSLDHTRYKTLPAHTPDGPTRYITLPASPARRPTRYKTLPAARLGGPPGTKLSQRARLGGPPGTKLSQHARLDHPPGTKLSPQAARRPTRYKTLPASGLGRPTRYKTLPASPKTPISAHLSHAGRTFYRFRHQQPEQGELYPACGAASGTKLSQQAPKRRFRPTFRMQGELCTASATNNPSRENNFAHQHPTAPQQRAPLQISHAIRLNELSTKPRNVANPTT